MENIVWVAALILGYASLVNISNLEKDTAFCLRLTIRRTNYLVSQRLGHRFTDWLDCSMSICLDAVPRCSYGL